MSPRHKSEARRLTLHEEHGDKILDNIAFADHRSGVPEEADNEFERDLYKRLQGYLDDNYIVPAAMTDAIKDILAAGLYSDVFREPTEEYVYRGMSVSGAFIRSALQIPTDKPVMPEESRWAKFTFTPKFDGNVSGWTTDINTAINFSGDNHSEVHRFYFVMVAAIKDNPHNFIIGESGFYDVKGLGGHRTEHEAIALGNVKVCRVAWGSTNTALELILKDDIDDEN